MKKNYRPLIKGTNWALAGILTMLGFSGCNRENNEPQMYGVPWASYAIKGTVVDKSTKEPIPGIEVKIALPDSILQHIDRPIPNSWTDKTNDKGNFKLSDTLYGDSIPVVATDIDGEQNGAYKPDTLYVNYKNAVHIGGGKGWFEGELTADIEFKLDAKDADE